MPTDMDPVVGNWYRGFHPPRRFRIVAIDEERGTAEAQTFDGDLMEFDLDTWEDLDLEVIGPSDDWSGPMDREQYD